MAALAPKKPRPFLLVLSAPSGAGKTTVCQGLLKRHPGLKRCVTATTRPPRGGERDGRDYYFLSPARFRRLLKAGGFYEHALVHGHHYGTPRGAVEQSLRRGRSLVLVIDVQGGLAVKRLRRDSVLVFLLPPSLGELKRRLRSRGTDSPGEIRRRLANARGELEAARRYDYLVVNGELEEAVDQVSAIYRAEGLRSSRAA